MIIRPFDKSKDVRDVVRILKQSGYFDEHLDYNNLPEKYTYVMEHEQEQKVVGLISALVQEKFSAFITYFSIDNRFKSNVYVSAMVKEFFKTLTNVGVKTVEATCEFSNMKIVQMLYRYRFNLSMEVYGIKYL